MTLLDTINDQQLWEQQAACASTTDEQKTWFFSDDITDISAAKRICLECPVRNACIETAVERGEQYGVWGGQYIKNGRIITSKRRRGRPPKIVKPEDELVIVPLPANLRKRTA